VLDDGRGHPRESIELLRSQEVEGLEGLGVLHAAASTGSLEVCVYLIEHLLFDVNAIDHEGLFSLLKPGPVLEAFKASAILHLH
jgi:hypothetical protein